DKLAHEVDPPARRVVFVSELTISRARRQTKTAVYARQKLLVVLQQQRRKTARAAALFGRYHLRILARQIPPTNRPGFKRHRGSKRIFISRIRPRVLPTSPQQSTSFFASADARSTTSVPLADWALRRSSAITSATRSGSRGSSSASLITPDKASAAARPANSRSRISVTIAGIRTGGTLIFKAKPPVWSMSSIESQNSPAARTSSSSSSTLD